MITHISQFVIDLLVTVHCRILRQQELGLASLLAHRLHLVRWCLNEALLAIQPPNLQFRVDRRISTKVDPVRPTGVLANGIRMSLIRRHPQNPVLDVEILRIRVRVPVAGGVVPAAVSVDGESVFHAVVGQSVGFVEVVIVVVVTPDVALQELPGFGAVVAKRVARARRVRSPHTSASILPGAFVVGGAFGLTVTECRLDVVAVRRCFRALADITWYSVTCEDTPT